MLDLAFIIINLLVSLSGINNGVTCIVSDDDKIRVKTCTGPKTTVKTGFNIVLSYTLYVRNSRLKSIYNTLTLYYEYYSDQS